MQIIHKTTKKGQITKASILSPVVLHIEFAAGLTIFDLVRQTDSY